MPGSTSSDARASTPPRAATMASNPHSAKGGEGKRARTTNPSTVESSSWQRQSRQHRSQASHGGSTSLPSAANASSPQHQSQLDHQPQSFTDQIAASALSGTYELLKLATGVTLSTGGKLYGHQVTRTLLLPSVFAAVVDYLSEVTPKRIQEWFRILSSSVYHIVDVLTQETPRGQDFRLRFAQFWLCFVECISSDTSRQVLVDGMSVWVRLAEAVNTPEVCAFLNQVAVAGCRVVDAASNGHNKELLHRAAALLWSGSDLLADPKTTCALAEVTAYLCHALEMEHAHVYQVEHTSHVPASSSSSTEHVHHRKRRAQERHERNAQQRATYDPILINTPNATVEQVILSSLGVLPPSTDDDNDSSDDDDDDGSSIPSKVEVCINEVAAAPDKEDNDTDKDDGGSSSKEKEEAEWYQRVKKGVQNSDVNVDVLQQKITERQAKHVDRRRRRRRQRRQTTEPPASSAVIPLAHHSSSSNKPPSQLLLSPKRVRALSDSEILDGFGGRGSAAVRNMEGEKKQKQTVQLVLDETIDDGQDAIATDDDIINIAWPRPDHPERREGEAPVEQFHRILDEILVQNRYSALKWVISEADKGDKEDKPRTTSDSAREGHVRKANTTFRDRIVQLRAELEKERRERQERANEAARKYGVVVYALLAGCLMAVLTFAGFGFYGMHIFFSQSATRGASSTPRTVPQGGAATSSSEFVIRVVREVVHVDVQGNVLDRKALDVSRSERPTPEETDKIASCIADSLLE